MNFCHCLLSFSVPCTTPPPASSVMQFLPLNHHSVCPELLSCCVLCQFYTFMGELNKIIWSLYSTLGF